MSDLDPKLRGLGRGLNALFEDEESVYPQADAEGLTPGRQRMLLGVGQLSPGTVQPRQSFDEEALAELADSIRQHGLLQPILVRPDKSQDDQYEIIAGERRWRAAQKAQLHDVPVVILDLTDVEALEIGLIENLQREDLNPVEEAHGYKKLQEEYGHTQEQIAEALGRSRPHVANMVRLLTLPDKVLKYLEKNEISTGHARALITAKDPEALAREVVAKGLNVRETEALAAEFSGRPQKKTSKPRGKDADTIALETEMSNTLGMRVTIDTRDGQKGTLKVEFKSLDQLDDLLQRLSGGGGAPSGGGRRLDE